MGGPFRVFPFRRGDLLLLGGKGGRAGLLGRLRGGKPGVCLLQRRGIFICSGFQFRIGCVQRVQLRLLPRGEGGQLFPAGCQLGDEPCVTHRDALQIFSECEHLREAVRAQQNGKAGLTAHFVHALHARLKALGASVHLQQFGCHLGLRAGKLCFTFLYFQLKHSDLDFDVLLLGRIQVHKVSGAGGVGPVLLDLLLDGLLLGTQPLQFFGGRFGRRPEQQPQPANGQQSGGAPHSFFVHPRQTSYSALR